VPGNFGNIGNIKWFYGVNGVRTYVKLITLLERVKKIIN